MDNLLDNIISPETRSIEEECGIYGNSHNSPEIADNVIEQHGDEARGDDGMRRKIYDLAMDQDESMVYVLMKEKATTNLEASGIGEEEDNTVVDGDCEAVERAIVNEVDKTEV